jgi:hypothetical protein
LRSLKIIGFCVLAAVFYGIVHDNVTARVCVEYFTIGHPPIFGTESPTALAFGWGIIATWWVGLGLGIPLAIAARAGLRPKLELNDLCMPIAWLLGFMACFSLIAGIAGYFAAQVGLIQLVEPLASRVPREKHVAFLADGAAHLAAYGVGILGGLFVVAKAWKKRSKPPAD